MAEVDITCDKILAILIFNSISMSNPERGGYLPPEVQKGKEAQSELSPDEKKWLRLSNQMLTRLKVPNLS